MADVPQCYACDNFNINNKTCKFYLEGIPHELLMQIIECSSYYKEPLEIDDDLPIATGR